MTDRELIALVSSAEQDAAVYNGEFTKENEKYLRGYLALKEGEFVAPPDSSSVVSTDIADVVESDLTSLARVFLSSGSILEFTPSTNNPTETAEAEEKTKYVNWVVRNQPDSFKLLFSWMKDALIQKNGVVKYFVEEVKETEEEEFSGLDQQELVDAIESLRTPDVTKVDVVAQDENEDGTFDLRFRVTRERKKICIINVPPELFLISKNASHIDDAELVGDKVRKTRGQLLSEGFKRDLIDQLPSVDSEDNQNGNLDYIRDKDLGGSDGETNIQNWASEYVDISDLYVKIDYDGDGIAERRHIMISGNKVLINEAFNHVPYASLSAYIMPHRAIGRSRAEVTYQTQLQKTALLRGMNNNIYMVNNPRNVVHPDVDLDDMLTVRENGLVRLDDDTQILPQNAVFPLQIPYIGDRTLQVIQYVDQARAQTTGILLANQGLDADAVAKETATRFSGIESAGQAKIELIARNFAETGFRKLYEGIAWLASKFQDTQAEIRVLGKQLSVKPSSWKYKHYTESKVGLGAGDNEQLVEARQGIYAIQQQLMSQGSPLVDSKCVYNNLMSLTDGLGFSRAERLFNDQEEPAELLLRQNELLNAMVLQMQEQIAQLQNPLAEAEAIKREGDIAIAQGKLALDAAKLEEQKRQFNVSTAQDNNKHNQDTAVKLTELEINSGQNVPGSVV